MTSAVISHNMLRSTAEADTQTQYETTFTITSSTLYQQCFIYLFIFTGRLEAHE